MSYHFENIEDRKRLFSEKYDAVRQQSRNLCKNLSPEDMTVQATTDVSPTKWHLAHTTWFFERFLLDELLPSYKAHNEAYYFLFNSYYESYGRFYNRSNRGLITRPSCDEIYSYRSIIDEQIKQLIVTTKQEQWGELEHLLTIGLNHEQQHQELILMDCKYNFFQNPTFPSYENRKNLDLSSSQHKESRQKNWTEISAGIYKIGASKSEDFSYDNEQGNHRVFIEDVEISNQLVTNREFQDFIEDGGYSRHELWLSEGWHILNKQNKKHPLYWQNKDNSWQEFSLYGLIPLEPNLPVSHISYYEADAYARWAKCRLPSEEEWEVFAQNEVIQGTFQESRCFHPSEQEPEKKNIYGNLWQWTSSSYGPYPGYKPSNGALGEYNGKFMSNQYVLRGGSFATPKEHIRATYRNYFPANSMWMFSGIRLAREIGHD